MAPRPPTIDPKAKRFYGEDTAKYLINPGTVSAPGRHTPGQLRHARPYLANGRKLFVFPTPVEGFSRSGQAQLGLRHYIGDWKADGVTIHYEEGRITLNGLFPGQTSQQNMVECLMMLRSKHKGRGLVLYAPGLFNREQYILPENWDFTHDEEDRTHSIHYSITFVKIGEGKKVADPLSMPPYYRPVTRKSKPKGKAARTYTVKAGARTLRTIAAKPSVYGDPKKWTQLLALNRARIESIQEKGTTIGSYKLPNYRLPVGFQLRY